MYCAAQYDSPLASEYESNLSIRIGRLCISGHAGNEYRKKQVTFDMEETAI